MSLAGGIFGAQYKPDSPEARTLKGFETDKFDYRDQQKNLIQLNSAVGYMSGYMRKMQKGIDDANQNFIQQIQSLISDLFVLVGGGGDTGFDFGDLKYVFQAWGALFGFDTGSSGLPLPLNLFSAAWHFFSNYLLPFGNFHDAMNMIIDAAIATMIDWFGDIPIVGQAVQQLAVFISNLRDILLPLADLLDGLMSVLTGDPLGGLSQVLSGIFGQLGSLLGFDVSGPLGFINSIITSLFNIPNFIVQIINNLFSKGFGALSPALDFINSITNGIFGWLSGFFNVVTGQTTNAGDVALQDAVNSAQALIEQQIANSLAILQLQNGNDGAQNSGMAAFDDFERTNNTDINSTAGANDLWDIRQDNALSNGYYAITDGHQAGFIGGTAGTSQTQYFRRKNAADMHTKTVYQRIAMVVGTFAGDPPFLSGPAWFRLRCRLNDADTQEVFCHIDTANNAQFGYRNGGAEIMVGSPVNIGSVTASTTLYLDAGEAGGALQFTLSKNTGIVHSWTDVSAVTAASTTDNLGWGFAGHAEGVAGGQKKPLSPAIISISDNVPSTTRGVGLRVSRTNTAAIAKTNGYSSFPSNCFDTVDRQANVNWNTAGQYATILIDGWYTFGINLQLNGTQNSGTFANAGDTWLTAIEQSTDNGTTWNRKVVTYINREFSQGNPGSGGTAPSAKNFYAGGSGEFYCGVGDLVRPAADTGSTDPVGTVDGAMTYFSAILKNRTAA